MMNNRKYEFVTVNGNGNMQVMTDSFVYPVYKCIDSKTGKKVNYIMYNDQRTLVTSVRFEGIATIHINKIVQPMMMISSRIKRGEVK